MGLKDSIQNVVARFKGEPRQSDAGALPVDSEEFQANLRALEAKLGYTFTNPVLLGNALLHRSHIHVTGQDRESSNERLEFLGDAVLGLVVNEDLYQRYPDRSEGDLTKMKSLLVCGARLSEVAVELDLGVHIRMSRSEAATGGRNRSSILADTTEAIIGAVYLDGGLGSASGVIRRVVLVDSDRVLARRSLRNYKSRLQELIQAEHKAPPRYKVLEVDGPDHDRMFNVAVTFMGRVLGMGEGRNKKSAEQNAAQSALDEIEKNPGLLGNDDTDS